MDERTLPHEESHWEHTPLIGQSWSDEVLKCDVYTVFQKKTPTHIIGYKLRNSCLILIIFGTNIPHIIWHRNGNLVVHLT